MHKTTLLWLVLLFFSLHSFSQTTNINGVVNVYTKVVEVLPAKACVRVSSTTGLIPSTKVLLLQMKGLTINNTTTSAVFGDTTAVGEGDVGNYEVGTICTIRGDSVFLVNTILNSYTVSGKVQLVQFGEYVSANVTGNVTAPAWNNTTGTGGVIAIFAEQDIILNANITVGSSGFAGGNVQNDNSGLCANTGIVSAPDYAYNGSSTTPQSGAFKGEGVVDLPGSQSGGRGAAANGGGGGNNHNNSGGGGANLSAGGMGGGNSSTSGCKANRQGEAGKRLSSWGGKKIFFGGGGGAGHTNNNSPSSGARGGGIIFIHADNLIFNGNQINAQGGAGSNSLGDGAGGGGAGGTIIMDVNTYADAPFINADGGHGGNSNDGGNFNSCYGGGGAGSGGVIYFKNLSPPGSVSAIGGAAGTETSSDPACVLIQASAGNAGFINTGYTYRASSTLAAYCSTILPVRLSFFKATRIGNIVSLRWEMPSPESIYNFTVERMNENHEWTAIRTVASSDSQEEYASEDSDPFSGYNYYRIRINGKNSQVSYSSIRQVFSGYETGSFTIYPNPATDRIIVRSHFTGSADIRLFDITGKLVLQKKTTFSNITEINLPHLSPGIYSLHINESVEKLVIK